MSRHGTYLMLCGARKETRTPNLLITNQLLYQLSYSGQLLYYTITPRKINRLHVHRAAYTHGKG